MYVFSEASNTNKDQTILYNLPSSNHTDTSTTKNQSQDVLLLDSLAQHLSATKSTVQVSNSNTNVNSNKNYKIKSHQQKLDNALKPTSSVLHPLKVHKTDAPMLNYIFDSHLASSKHHHHDHRYE